MTKSVGRTLLKWELNNSRLFLNSIFDFIFPRFCPACNNKLSINENVVCSNCILSIKRIQNDFLQKEYQKKFANDNLIADFQSLFIFEKEKELQKIIHGLKYENKVYIGKFLGLLLAQELLNELKKWNADFIMPIPLHSLKKAQRGYNQSYYIAKGISSVLKIPVVTSTIKRNRFTESQTKKSAVERRINVEGAFSVRKATKVKNKKIILVDDVITTGATISECARILKNSGAKNIYAVSIAIADDYILSGADTPNIDKPFFNTI